MSVPTIAIWHPKGPGRGYVVINLADYTLGRHHPYRDGEADPRETPETGDATRCNALPATSDDADDATSTSDDETPQNDAGTVESTPSPVRETPAQKKARQRAAKKAREQAATQTPDPASMTPQE
jgi:hypothetical protein